MRMSQRKSSRNPWGYKEEEDSWKERIRNTLKRNEYRKVSRQEEE